MRDFTLFFEGPPAAERARALCESTMAVLSNFGVGDPVVQYTQHWLSDAVEIMETVVHSMDAHINALRAKLRSGEVADEEQSIVHNELNKAESALHASAVAMLALLGSELSDRTVILGGSGPLVADPDDRTVL
jgi:hypothetical protein